MFGRKNDKPDQTTPGTPPPQGEPSDSKHEQEVDPDAIDAELTALREEVSKLALERDEAVGNFKRALADYHNFQRRAASNEVEAKRQGVTSVLGSVLPVLDHFDLALTQATPDDASRRIMDGVKVIRDELVKAFEIHGVRLINPKPNDEFDPTKHSAIMQQAVEGVEPGRVSATFQPGYTLGERVLRSAKVAVAPAGESPTTEPTEVVID